MLNTSHDVNTKPQPQQPPTRRKKQGTPSGENSKKGSSPGNSHSQHDEVIPSVQILEILMRENATLNAELVNARRKIETIHKVSTKLIESTVDDLRLVQADDRVLATYFSKYFLTLLIFNFRLKRN